MTQLVWNEVGTRYFETGVDHGVFYTSQGVGLVWNGLTAVKEATSGGEAVPYYYEGEKYLNVSAYEEFGGTIEAYTYPDEFSEYDGSTQMYEGFTVNLQARKPFSLSYRTRIGNDVDGDDHGYKIHIIYNLLASPASKDYSTVSGSADAMNFAWSFTTMPVYSEFKSRTFRTAHVVIDSTRVSPGLLRSIENHLYGSTTSSSSLMSLDKLIYWFESGGEPLELVSDSATGLAYVIESLEGGNRDLVRTDNDGLMNMPSDTRLEETTTDGLYTLET